jgi:SAM-dependent MidA family methyltransferase
MAADWPQPSPAALKVSAELCALIRARLAAAGGWINFAEFMDLALYAPGLGYYSAGAQKFGEAGDFVTAPELSPAYGACLARAIAPLLRPGDAILELGAGSGALAQPLLDVLPSTGAPAVDYRILEVSGELRARQAERLAGYPVQWLDRLPGPGFQGVILANEVADALPVQRFSWQGGDVQELGVARAAEGFRWAARPAASELRTQVRSLMDRIGAAWPPGYRSEFCPGLRPWVRGLAGVLLRGLILVCDYGLTAREYYHADRSDGTLVCHYRHRAHGDPFRWPGLQDISAWVDFSAAAQAGVDAGLTLAGFTTQAQFLLANGLVDAAPPADPVAQASHAAALRRLLLPGEMGERFKVLALGRGLAAEPLRIGRDFRARL